VSLHHDSGVISTFCPLVQSQIVGFADDQSNNKQNEKENEVKVFVVIQLRFLPVAFLIFILIKSIPANPFPIIPVRLNLSTCNSSYLATTF